VKSLSNTISAYIYCAIYLIFDISFLQLLDTARYSWITLNKECCTIQPCSMQVMPCVGECAQSSNCSACFAHHHERLLSLQVHGHYPSSTAAHVIHRDQGCGGCDLGSGSAPGLSSVLLLYHGAVPRPGGVLHSLAWIHRVQLQKDVSLSLEQLFKQSTSVVNCFSIDSECGRMLFVFSGNECKVWWQGSIFIVLSGW